MTATIRTDIHRPSAIDPADYQYVGVEYMKLEDIGACLMLQEERKAIVAHMKMTGGTYSSHQHGGNCHICGAHCIYTVLFYHPPTNSYIRTGMDCAEKMHQGDPAHFRAIRDAVTAAREAKAGKLKAQGILEAEGLSEAWAIYTHCKEKGTTGVDRDSFVVADIVDKIVRYGNPSPAQINFVRGLLDRIRNRPQIEAQRAAEKAQAQDCPNGRLTLACVVIKTEVRDSDYGTQYKMTLKAEGGFILWGSIPNNLQLFDVPDGGQSALHRGDKIMLTATITRSDKDSKFGFFKRPIASLIGS